MFANLVGEWDAAGHYPLAFACAEVPQSDSVSLYQCPAASAFDRNAHGLEFASLLSAMKIRMAELPSSENEFFEWLSFFMQFSVY
jgi:hypothetical protein